MNAGHADSGVSWVVGFAPPGRDADVAAREGAEEICAEARERFPTLVECGWTAHRTREDFVAHLAHHHVPGDALDLARDLWSSASEHGQPIGVCHVGTLR